ncbi:MAG: response regulator [Candidatus Aenigmatarchaeota archaeon]
MTSNRSSEMPVKRASRKPRKPLKKPRKLVAVKKAKLKTVMSAGNQKPSIMVVDDDESVLVLIRELLEQEGMKVMTAAGGVECLDKLEHVKPDLLILDVMMSKITGLDVAEAVRLDPRLRNVKMIFLTVVKPTEIKPALLNRLAASDYIAKPFDNDDFVRRVRWVLTEK